MRGRNFVEQESAISSAGVHIKCTRKNTLKEFLIMKINIQESLKERDAITGNRYNLYSNYCSHNYTVEQKKNIAEAIYKGATDRELLEMIDDAEVEYREVQEYARANSNRRFRDEDGNVFSIWDLLNDFIDWELDDKVEEEPDKSVKELFIDYIRNSTSKNRTLEEIREDLTEDNDVDRDYAFYLNLIDIDVKDMLEEYHEAGNKSPSEILVERGYTDTDSEIMYRDVKDGDHTYRLVIDFEPVWKDNTIHYYVLKDGKIPSGYTYTKTTMDEEELEEDLDEVIPYYYKPDGTLVAGYNPKTGASVVPHDWCEDWDEWE